MSYVTRQAQRQPIVSIDVSPKRRVQSPILYTTFWSVILLLTDVAMFIIAASLAHAIVDHAWTFKAVASSLYHSSMVFIAVWIGMFYILGLYQRSFALSFKDESYFAVMALLLGVAPQLVIFTIWPSLSTSRMALVLSAALAIVFVGTSRAVIHFARSLEEKSRARRVLILGDQSRVASARNSIAGSSDSNIVTLTLDPQDLQEGSDSIPPQASVAGAEAWYDAAIKWRCERVVLTDLQDQENIRRFLVLCEDSGIKVLLALPEALMGSYELEVERQGNQHYLAPVRPKIARPISRRVKRLFDAAFGLLALVLCCPVMLVAGFAVWLESGAPIFFRQERVGRFGSIFQIIKFRTMKVDADSAWATPGDSRITRVGAVLRRLSIDELPQLFNVLLGDMSLVGPRPEMRAFEAAFAAKIPMYSERRLALPGITGWAQVNMERNLAPEDVEQVLSYDLFYIQNWSVFLDLTVLLKTATEFLFHRAV